MGRPKGSRNKKPRPPHSAETRRKLSEAQRRRWGRPEEHAKMSVAQTRRFADPAERQRDAEGQARRFRDPSEREKISRSLKGNRNAGSREEHYAWNGGRRVRRGYIVVLVDGEYVLEHRIVMAQKLGRPLLPSEVVHHEDGNKQNNDPSNLTLFENNGLHMSHHARMRRRNG